MKRTTRDLAVEQQVRVLKTLEGLLGWERQRTV